MENKEEEMIKHRGWFHEDPALSFQEEKGHQYWLDRYKDKEVEVQSNLDAYRPKVTIGFFDGKGI